MRRLITIGLPKCGTTSIYLALARTGLPCAHYKHGSRLIASIVRDNMRSGCPPLANLPQCVSQLDACSDEDGVHYFPQCDWDFHQRVRDEYPDAVLLLNVRDVGRHAESMANWKDYQRRLTRADIPGLPRGRGSTEAELRAWIRDHNLRMRAMHRGDPRLVEVDIERPDAPQRIGRALGVELRWWGVVNQSPGRAA